MISLRTLGAVGLTGADGRDCDGLLRQPKRLALLIYLAAPHPGAWHRRETLLGIFWPDVDSSRARVALRNSLYVIRQSLGTEVIRTRGDEEISLDPASLSSDAADLGRALSVGDLAAAVTAYAGEFLPGFYVNDVGEFERWVDGERERLRSAAVKAATQLSIEREQGDDPAGAIEVLHRLATIDPNNESAVRRLIELLDRRGDHGQALAAFERLQTWLRTEFQAEPSRETVQLVNAIRSRRSPGGTARPTTAPTASEPEREAVSPVPLAVTPRRRSIRRAIVAGSLLVVAGTVAAIARPRGAATPVPTTLLVLPMENATGDRANDYIASGLANDLATRLTTLTALAVKSAAMTDWPAPVRDSLSVIGPAFGTQVVLRSRLTRAGDSLSVEADVVDVVTRRVRRVALGRFLPSDLRDAGSHLAASVAGAVFRVPLPEVPRLSTRQSDPEAYRLTLLGWHRLLLQSDPVGAREAFLQATKLDPMLARAWSGLSSTWAADAVNGRIPFDEGFALAEAAAVRAIALDSLQGTAWANLGILMALRDRSTAAGERFFAKAFAAEPGNAESFMIYATVQSQAGQWDRARDAIRIARQLDPLTAFYAGREANLSFCAGQTDEALRLYRQELELDPSEREGHIGVARSLARLGRWDEAIDQLRQQALAQHDSGFDARIGPVRGEAGYWRAKHIEGEALLRQRQALRDQSWAAPYLLGVAEIGAGHLDQGLEILEGEAAAGSRMLYKLACNPEVDEARSTTRFRRLLSEAGRLPENSERGSR